MARDQFFLQIAPSGATAGLRLKAERRWSSPESPLQPIAEAMARTVSEEDFSPVQACEGPACILLLADHTQGHRRRRCGMAVCRNRARQQAHYHRHHSRD